MSIINKTVNDVLATFNKAINDLECIQNKCQQASEKQEKIIEKAVTEKEHQDNEKNRAIRVANKIRALVE